MTAPLLADRVAELWTGTGTGAVTPSGALVGGYRTWGAAFEEGDQVHYVIAHRSLSEFEVGTGTIGSGGTLQRDGAVLTSSNANALVDFSAGEKDVFCAVDAATLMGSGVVRRVVEVETPPLEIGDEHDFTVPWGRSGLLLALTLSHSAWLRLYTTAAARTADTRTDPDDPVPALDEESVDRLLLQTILLADDHSLTWVPPQPLVLANLETPAAAVLYGRVMRLGDDGAISEPSTAIGDTFGDPGASDIALSVHTVTDPGASGADEWEYAAGGSDWRVKDYGGATRPTGTADTPNKVARLNAALLNENFRAWIDVYRLSVLREGFAGIAWCLPSTAIGSWDGNGYLFCGLYDPNAVEDRTVVLIHRDAAGDETILAESAEFAMPVSSGRRLIVEVRLVSGTHKLSAWLADLNTGANPTQVLTDVTLPDLTANGAYMGMVCHGSASSVEAHVINRWYIEPLDQPGSSTPVAIDFTQDRLAA